MEVAKEEVSSDAKLLCSTYSEWKAEMLKSGKHSDVQFVFDDDGEKTSIKAHSQLLATASEVFEVMMYGDLGEKSEIFIADISPATFLLMLKYIYDDYVHLDSIDAGLDLYRAAHKYRILSLIKKCAEYVQSRLRMDCVFRVLEFAKLYEDADLNQSVLDYCRNNAKSLFLCDEFYISSIDMVIMLFQLGPFDVDNEILVLDAALKYANAHEESQSRVIEVFQSVKLANLDATEFAKWMLNNKDDLNRIGEHHFLKVLANLFCREEHNVYMFPEYTCGQSSMTDGILEKKTYEMCRNLGDCMPRDVKSVSTSLHFCAVNFTELVGVRVATRMLSKDPEKCIKYHEDISFTLRDCIDTCNIFPKIYFNGVVKSNSEAWMDFRPVKIFHNNWYTLYLPHGVYFYMEEKNMRYMNRYIIKQAFDVRVSNDKRKTVIFNVDDDNSRQLITGLKFR